MNGFGQRKKECLLPPFSDGVGPNSQETLSFVASEANLTNNAGRYQKEKFTPTGQNLQKFGKYKT